MNYPQHNKSLHGTLMKPEEPVIFCKTDSALLKNGKPFFIPDDLGRIEYEGELVVRICRLGKSVPVRFAHRYYDAFTVGVDFTARELQARLRAKGLPWSAARASTTRRSSANGSTRTSCLRSTDCGSVSTSTAIRCRRVAEPTCSSLSTRQ